MMPNTEHIGSEIHVDWNYDKDLSPNSAIATKYSPAGRDISRTDPDTDGDQDGSNPCRESSDYRPNPVLPGVSTAPDETQRHLRSRNYATPEGWRQYREKIIELYKEKTLRDVLEIMEIEHNFVATERMYKARFKEWGFSKNVTADVAADYIARLPSGEQGNSPREGRDSPVSDLPNNSVAHLNVDRIRKYVGRGSSGLNKLEAKERKRVIAVFGSPNVNRIHKNARSRADRPGSRLHEEETKARRLPLVPAPNPEHVLNCLKGLLSSAKSVCSLHTSATTTPFDNPLLSVYPDPDYFNLSNPWPTRDPALAIQEWHMLDFEIKFRLAHILQDRWNQEPHSRLLQACLDGLSHALEATGPAGAITCLIYMILTALETATSFGSSSILSWLFDQLSVIWAQHHPLTANIAVLLSHYDSHENLFDLLKKARQVIPTDPGSIVAASTGLQVYLEIVDVAVNTGLPAEVYSTVQAITNRLLAGTSEALIVWVELRGAIALDEVNTLASHPTSSPQSGPVEPRPKAISRILDNVRMQRDFYESNSGWAIAGRLDREIREISRLVEGASSEAAAIPLVRDSERARPSLGVTGSSPRRSCGRCGASGHYVQTCKEPSNAS